MQGHSEVKRQTQLDLKELLDMLHRTMEEKTSGLTGRSYNQKNSTELQQQGGAAFHQASHYKGEKPTSGISCIVTSSA